MMTLMIDFAALDMVAMTRTLPAETMAASWHAPSLTQWNMVPSSVLAG